MLFRSRNGYSFHRTESGSRRTRSQLRERPIGNASASLSVFRFTCLSFLHRLATTGGTARNEIPTLPRDPRSVGPRGMRALRLRVVVRVGDWFTDRVRIPNAPLERKSEFAKRRRVLKSWQLQEWSRHFCSVECDIQSRSPRVHIGQGNAARNRKHDITSQRRDAGRFDAAAWTVTRNQARNVLYPTGWVGERILPDSGNSSTE